MNIILSSSTIFFSILLLTPYKSLAQWIHSNGAGSGRPTCVIIQGINYFAGTEFGGVIRSTDMGASWACVNNGLSQLSIFSLASVNGHIFAGTRNGVFSSTNNGDNWVSVSSGLPLNTAIFQLAVNGSNIFAATRDSGIFATTNMGISWTNSNNGLSKTYIRALGVAGSYIYISTSDSLFRSNNMGVNWITISNREADCFASNSNYFFIISVGEIFRSTDYGLNWDTISAGLGNNWVTTLAADDNYLIAGTYSQGLFLSTDQGANWTHLFVGTPDTLTNVNSVNIASPNFLVSTEIGVFLSTNGGFSWNKGIANLYHKSVWSLTSIGSDLFAGAEGGVYRSSDNGNNWACVLRAEERFNGTYSPIFTKDTILYAIGSGIFRSVDHGSHWIYFQNKWTRYTCFTVCDGDIFAGTELMVCAFNK